MRMGNDTKLHLEKDGEREKWVLLFGYFGRLNSTLVPFKKIHSQNK